MTIIVAQQANILASFWYNQDNFMVYTIKIAASILATGIGTVAYIPYLIDMFRGKNKPHLYTWISFFLVTAVVSYIQLLNGAGVGVIPTVVTALIDAIILFYCFRFGTRDIVFMDKICLTVSIIGVVTYFIFHTLPILSLILLTTAEVISFIPTFRKTKNDPYSESLTSYYLTLIKIMLIFIALQSYNLLTVSYPVVWFIVFIVFLTVTYYIRLKKPSTEKLWLRNIK